MTVFKDVSDETRAERLRRIAQFARIGRVKYIADAYPDLSHDERSQLIKEGEEQLRLDEKRREEIQKEWRPPARRDVIGKTIVSLSEAITWLGLGVMLDSKALGARQADCTWHQSVEFEVAFQWGWQTLLEALVRSKITARGSKYGKEPKAEIPRVYFEEPIYPNLIRHDAIGPDWERAWERDPDAIERYENITFLDADILSIVNLSRTAVDCPNVSGTIYPVSTQRQLYQTSSRRGRPPNHDLIAKVRGVCEMVASSGGLHAFLQKTPKQRRDKIRQAFPKTEFPCRTTLDRWINRWINEKQRSIVSDGDQNCP